MPHTHKGKIIVAGAGSGGHVLTAIATIEAVKQRYPQLYKHIIYVGTNRLTEYDLDQPSLEEKLCRRLNIPFIKIQAGKLQRRPSISSVKMALKIPISFADAYFKLRKLKPTVTISFGGYVGLPVTFVSHLLGAYIFVHEQTVNFGLSNRLSAYFADKILLSFKDSLKYMPESFRRKSVVVGYPVRDVLFKYTNLRKLLKEVRLPLSLIEDLRKLNRNKAPTILVLGGGLGSHLLNTTIEKLAPKLLRHFNIVLQTGDNKTTKDYQRIKRLANKLNKRYKNLFLVSEFFNEELGFLYSKADLIVARSGAGLVYQIALFKKPAILVPIPWVSNNEQYNNAKKLERLGLARILEQKKLTPTTLYQAINQTLRQPAKPNVSKLESEFPKNVAPHIANLILQAYENRS